MIIEARSRGVTESRGQLGVLGRRLATRIALFAWLLAGVAACDTGDDLSACGELQVAFDRCCDQGFPDACASIPGDAPDDACQAALNDGFACSKIGATTSSSATPDCSGVDAACRRDPSETLCIAVALYNDEVCGQPTPSDAVAYCAAEAGFTVEECLGSACFFVFSTDSQYCD